MNDLLQRLEAGSARIAIVGLGYVGLPLALGFARQGFTVFGIDPDESKIEQLRGGIDPVEGQHAQVRATVQAGLFVPSLDDSLISRADAVIICVPTPLSRNREPDLEYIRVASRSVAAHIHAGTLVVLQSTTYPGTTEEVVLPEILAGGRVGQVGQDFYLAFSPERVDPGNAHYHTCNTTKVVGGVTPACSRLAAALYARLLGKTELVKQASSTRAAELEKLFENIFRSVNIALVNELALLCREMQLDVWEILDLASTKPFGFMRFNPGPASAGTAFPSIRSI